MPEDVRGVGKMASSKDYMAFIVEQLSDLEGVAYRGMMGEFVLYYRGKVVGGVFDDRLLVKATPSALALLGAAVAERPYPGAKEMLRVDNVDDRAFLQSLLEAMVEEVPETRRRKPR